MNNINNILLALIYFCAFIMVLFCIIFIALLIQWVIEVYKDEKEVKEVFRVYDIEENRWVKNKCFMDSKENLHIVNKTFLGNVKMNLVSSDRYIYQYEIGLDDINGVPIYEGDICESTDGKVGIITYVPEFASYLILDYKTMKHFILTAKICSENLKVIGNVFEKPEKFEVGE